MKKSTISSAVALIMGTASYGAQASLASTAVLSFDLGTKFCVIGGTFPNCTYGVTNITSGSFFGMDTDGNGLGGNEKTAIESLNGIAIGTTQPAIDIDKTWIFFCNPGNHQSTSNVNILSDDGAGNVTLDFSGWNVTWNMIPSIPMGAGASNGIATMTCAASCSVGDTYVLDYLATVPAGDPSGFGNVDYTLHLEGTVGAVPVPAAVWLFGSGLLGLVGVARRKSRS